jgi:hypothetical protein
MANKKTGNKNRKKSKSRKRDKSPKFVSAKIVGLAGCIIRPPMLGLVLASSIGKH